MEAQAFYVANNAAGGSGQASIYEYNADGSPANGGTFVSGLTGVTDVGFSGSNVLVETTSGVTEYTSGGTMEGAGPVVTSSSFNLIATSGLNFYVSDSSAGTVTEYTLNPADPGTATQGVTISDLTSPTGLAVSASDLFITSAVSDGSILEYTLSGSYVGTIATGLNDPVGLAISGSNLYVLNFNSGDGSVGEYTLGSTPGSVTSSSPSLISTLSSSANPWGIAVLGSNLLIAEDFGATPDTGLIEE